MLFIDKQVRRSTKCYCGEELTIQNVKPPILDNTEYAFYGGRVKKYSNLICSKCGRKFIGLINSSFEVFDTIEDEYDKKMTLEEYELTKKILDETEEQIVEENSNNEKILEQNEENDRYGIQMP